MDWAVHENMVAYPNVMSRLNAIRPIGLLYSFEYENR